MSKNAEEIAALGRTLYDRISNFADNLDKVGRGLDSASKAYNAAVGSFESTLLPGARKFQPGGVSLSAAIGDRVDDPDDHVVAAVLAFASLALGWQWLAFVVVSFAVFAWLARPLNLMSLGPDAAESNRDVVVGSQPVAEDQRLARLADSSTRAASAKRVSRGWAGERGEARPGAPGSGG